MCCLVSYFFDAWVPLRIQACCGSRCQVYRVVVFGVRDVLQTRFWGLLYGTIFHYQEHGTWGGATRAIPFCGLSCSVGLQNLAPLFCSRECTSTFDDMTFALCRIVAVFVLHTIFAHLGERVFLWPVAIPLRDFFRLPFFSRWVLGSSVY